MKIFFSQNSRLNPVISVSNWMRMSNARSHLNIKRWYSLESSNSYHVSMLIIFRSTSASEGKIPFPFKRKNTLFLYVLLLFKNIILIFMHLRLYVANPLLQNEIFPWRLLMDNRWMGWGPGIVTKIQNEIWKIKNSFIKCECLLALLKD